MGKSPNYISTNNLMIRLVGIEKVYLEGAIFGVILYLISSKGKSKGKILKWNVLQPPRGIINPEVLLTLEIPNAGLTFKELLFKSFFGLFLMVCAYLQAKISAATMDD